MSAIGLPFFLLPDYRNIDYQTGEFAKLQDYWISNQGLNLSDIGFTRNYRLPSSVYFSECQGTGRKPLNNLILFPHGEPVVRSGLNEEHMTQLDRTAPCRFLHRKRYTIWFPGCHEVHPGQFVVRGIALRAYPLGYHCTYVHPT